jgi:hypothetical protein
MDERSAWQFAPNASTVEHARSQVRREWRHTARTNLRVLVVLGAVAGALCTVELLLPSPLWWRSYLLGFFTASLFGVAIWAWICSPVHTI